MSCSNKKKSRLSQIEINVKPSTQFKQINKLSIKSVVSSRLPDHIKINRLNTEVPRKELRVPYQGQWDQIYNRRENFLNSMFNRRKTILEDISRKNRDIYVKILNQQSHYCATKPLKEQSSNKNLQTIQNLTANSRLLITLSKHALSNQLHPIHKQPLINKENNLVQDQILNNNWNKNIEKASQNNQLYRIIQASVQRTIESRYIKQQLANRNKSVSNKIRNRSVGRTRLADLYVNF